MRDHGWGPDDPVFPALANRYGENGQFQHDGFERRCWATSQPVRVIFARACKAAGQPYFNPHTMRSMQVHWLHKQKPSEEQLKALSQNLGHADVAVTRIHYGQLGSQHQGNLIADLGAEASDDQGDVESEIVGLLEQVVASYAKRRRT